MSDNWSFLASCIDPHYGFMKVAIDVEAPTFWETKHSVQFFQSFPDGKRLAAIDNTRSLMYIPRMIKIYSSKYSF